ncbi:MFS transporter [Ignatzschineria larvae DSM 13226]|uniref:MFS transporter n=1 Tax=Ignatzschineria larvae DSM 13226 TaxID=1111732 RepID=A0ABZ3BXR5_9GAMM|nr:MFS transporter [Ignatzschineria larvae]
MMHKKTTISPAQENQTSVDTGNLHKLSKGDWTLSSKLAGLFAIRMLGIFIILPIYSLYTKELQGSTPFLAGLFISSYALTQIILQPLFGSLSDYFGRKVTIVLGMGLFVIGSLMIAFTDSIHFAIWGRVVQGAGAISAVVLAFTSDVVREEIRGKAMAIIGMSIGITFGLAIFISPLIYGFLGGMGIFSLCALLGIIAIYVTIWQLPKSEQHKVNRKEKRPLLHSMKEAWSDRDINRLYFGGFMLHLILTLGFTVFPWLLLDKAGFEPQDSWKIYLPGFVIAMLLVFPAIGVAERFRKFRGFFLTAIATLVISLIALAFVEDYWYLLIFMTLFFWGFNLMEAMQPSLMSRLAPEHNRGMVMGFFSSSQFLGASIGGMVASLILGYFTKLPALLVGAGLLMLWFAIAFPMKNPQKRATTTADSAGDSDDTDSDSTGSDSTDSNSRASNNVDVNEIAAHQADKTDNTQEEIATNVQEQGNVESEASTLESSEDQSSEDQSPKDEPSEPVTPDKTSEPTPPVKRKGPGDGLKRQYL